MADSTALQRISVACTPGDLPTPNRTSSASTNSAWPLWLFVAIVMNLWTLFRQLVTVHIKQERNMGKSE